MSELDEAVAAVKERLEVKTAPASLIASHLPEHLRSAFWEQAMEYYLLDQNAFLDAAESNGFLAERNNALAQVAELTAERDRLHKHSTTLNSVSYRIAEALTEAKGAEQYLGDPVADVERLIAERDAAVARLGEEQRAHEATRADVARYRADADRSWRLLYDARAELVRLRPVVEAAPVLAEVAEMYLAAVDADPALEFVSFTEAFKLTMVREAVAAVDVYRSGTADAQGVGGDGA